MSNKLNFFTLFYIFANLCFSCAEYISLNGNDWTAINNNKTIRVKTVVPGSIYSDLRREGVLKEDIYFGYNDLNYRWVSYDNWTYERTFDVSPTILNKQVVNLVIEGLDTISTIYLNDKELGQTNNQFVKYIFDIKSKLKAKQNTIRIVFTSSPIYAKESAQQYLKKYHYSVQPDCNPEKYNGECHFNFIRKMAASFSWDWGPAFPTQGIWKPIGIEAYDRAVISDILVETTSNPKNTTEWTLAVKCFVDTFANEVEVVFNISLDGNQLLINEKRVLRQESNQTANTTFVIPIKSVPIIPWFPNGVANNTQQLYQLNVSLSFADSQEVSVQSKRIGFRTIELVQEKIEPKGLSFYFKVNGLPFFAKGSNWIPAHVLMEELTPDYIRHLLGSAKKANMNMMRVWGGGVYESDLFYQLADEMGIMIWQDFMFACALYPSDDQFLKSVELEAITQVRRLQHHPSIAIWAGNNENELGLANWWMHRPETKEGYYKLYVDTIKRIVDREDTSRPFVTSSPSNGLETVKENYTAGRPDDPLYGDVHFYDDGTDLWNYRAFPRARFVSEYGFQSYPSLETFAKVIAKSELIYPISKAVEERQHHGTFGTNAIENQISNHMRLPSSGGIQRFNDLIYLSQITQAMAMKSETEFYRRNRDVDPQTGLGFTMGALYWQLNDIWEAPTWASIEFGGKWKVLHSFARSFLDNHLISPYESSYNALKVAFVRDDYLGILTFNYTIRVYDWSKVAKPQLEINKQIETDSFSSKVIYEGSVSELLNRSNCVDRSQCVFRFEISNTENNIKAENFLLLTEPKNSRILDPKLELIDVKRRTGQENQTQEFEITLSAKTVAPFVVLDFQLDSGITGQFLENGFFIFDVNKTIVFETNQNLNEQQIRDKLTFKTLADVVSKEPISLRDNQKYKL